MNVRLGAKTAEFNKKMNQVSRQINRVGRNIKKIGTTISRNFSLPFAAAGVASVKMSLDFQKSMTKIQTLVGRTDQEIATMKESIMGMATETSKAPVELAEGLYFLESAGLSGTNALETLEAVAKGSASGLGEMEALSVVAAAAQNAYGEETLSASEALDKFGVMVRTGMFDAQELSQVLGRQLGLAANLGISFDEVGAMISTYTQTTGDATAATNGLSAIMTTFAKLEAEPTKQQAEALKAVGMSAEDVKRSLSEQGLAGTLMMLQEKFKEQDIPMAQFFGKSQALKSVLGVLGNQTEAYGSNLDSLVKSQEFINDAFKTTSEDEAFKMQQALNNLKVASTQFGNTLLPVVTVLSEKIMKLTTFFTGLSDETKRTITNVGIFVAVAGPLVAIFGKLVMFGGSVVKMYKNYKTAVTVAGGVQKAFNAVLIANPIGLIITAIGAAIAAIIYFSTSTSNVAIKVRNAFKFLVNSALMGINKLIDGVNTFSERLGFSIPKVKLLSYETENLGDDVEDTSDKVNDLAKNLNNVPGNTGAEINFTTTGGDTDEDTEEEDEKAKQKRLEENAKQSLKNIRRLKQQFNVLNAEDSQQAELIALENQRKNALDSVAESNEAENEKFEINKLFDKKREQLLAKHTQDNIDANKKIQTEWEKTYEKLSNGWQKVQGVASQVFNAIAGFQQAEADKEQQIMDNKSALEDQELEQWYSRELEKLEASITNEEQFEAAKEELDKAADIKRENLDKTQDDREKEFARKSAKRDKGQKVMSAIMGTAQAVVNALGTGIPPLNFALAAIVGAMGIKQVAAIKSTPLPALAEGGIAFGPTLAQVGEYSGARSNPEVIAPLNKLKSLISGNMSNKPQMLFSKVSGNDIFLTNDLAVLNRTRFT